MLHARSLFNAASTLTRNGPCAALQWINSNSTSRRASAISTRSSLMSVNSDFFEPPSAEETCGGPDLARVLCQNHRNHRNQVF